ncbi:hypothetical protein [Mycolicibacter virginiensis]|uniref:hypothetical protein n=1 Tax=Mycolicibacter virginiensis TaxID=1795032 RepID=UPI00256F3865|nr:hypothetical protein [Mycolicibacter virginiensis]
MAGERFHQPRLRGQLTDQYAEPAHRQRAAVEVDQISSGVERRQVCLYFVTMLGEQVPEAD